MASDNNCHATNGPGGPLPEYFSEILRGKDKMIKVQAKRIEMLEYEVHRLRLVRETLSSQLALAICQLQQQGRLPPGQPLETAFLASSSESVALQANGHSAKLDKSSENLNSQKAAPPSNQHFNGESTLTRRQEQLASKYGGSARASRAASKIQQTFRQYSLNRNFEKLRQEVENTRSGDRRLKLRRFNKNEERADDQRATVSDIVDKEFGDIDEDADPESLVIGFGSKDQLFIAEEDSSRESSPTDNSSSNLKGDTKTHKEATVIKKGHRSSKDDDPRPSGIIDPSSVNFEKVLEEEDDDDDSVIVPSTGSAEDQLKGLKKLEKQLRIDEHLGLEKFRLLSLRERFGGSLCAPATPMTSNGFQRAFQSNDSSLRPGLVPASAQRQTSNDRAFTSTFSEYHVQDPVRRNLSEEYNSLCQQQQPAVNVTGDASPVWRRKPNNSWLSGAALEANPLFNNASVAHHFNGDAKDDYFGSSATSSTADSTSLGSGDAVNAAIAASSFDADVSYSSSREGVSGPHGLTDRQTKRLYRIGLNLFNRKPEKGIQFLISYRFVENQPRSVARFLLTRKGLSKQMIGSYLGNLLEQFNMDVLDCFASEIDLTGLEIDTALRKFQSHFRMPGEAQKIQRLMEVFASCYCESNPGVVSQFQSPDIVLLLSYAIVMLNTDLHNNSIKPEKKMNCQQFTKNLKGLDCGRDISHDMLQGIYDRISSSPLKPANDHVVQVAKVDNMIIGKKPILVEPHRRLVCYCRLFEVFDPLKREKSNQHQREIFLFNDVLMVTKQSTKKKNSFVYNYRESFPLAGMTIVLFDLPHCRHGIQLLSGHDNLVLITFCAKNEIELKKFVEDLNEAILEVNEMETLRMQEELAKRNGSDPTLNYVSVGSSHYSSTPSIQSRGSGDQIPPYLMPQHQSNNPPNDAPFGHDPPSSSGLSLAESRQYMYSHLAGFQTSTVFPQGNSSLNRHSKDSGIVDVDAPTKHYNMPDELRSKLLSFQSSPMDSILANQKMMHRMQNQFAYFNESLLDPSNNNRNSSGSLDSGVPSNVSGSTNSVPEKNTNNPPLFGQSFMSSGHPQGHKTAGSLVGSMNHGITSSASSLVSSSSSSSSSSKFNLFARKNKPCKTEEQ